MCGLVGIAGAGINIWDLDVLKDLVFFSSTRGTDSVGVFQGRTKGGWNNKDHLELIVHKEVIDPVAFVRRIKNDKKEKLLNTVTADFIAVHTRAATKGWITEENAHPFEFSKIVGMHNGTIHDKKYSDKDKTDSELFLKDINDNGTVSVLRTLSYGAAYAIVMLDKETGEIIFARNDQRPLWVCVHEKRDVMYWASEEWMLKAAMEKNKEKIYKNKIYHFAPHSVYRVHPQDIKGGTDKQFVISRFTYKPSTPKIDNTAYEAWGAWNSENYYRRQHEKKEEKKAETKFVVIKNDNPPNKEVPFSTKIPMRFCCACHKPMSLVEQYFGQKFGRNAMVHEECAEIHFPWSNEEVKVG